MEEKLVMNCGKFRIVAEICPNNGMDIPPELCVYVEDRDGNQQDICLVRKHLQLVPKTMQFETFDDFIDLLIWGDSDSEDYTQRQVIALHDFEEDEDS